MIPYDLKKIRCLIFDVDGVLSAETIPMSHEGEPLRTVNIKDGYAIQQAIKVGMPVVILTGGNTEAVRRRYENLGVKDIFMGASQKETLYNRYTHEHGLTDEEVMYMGDDIPDIPVLRRVGCPCCPKDACSDVANVSIYVSDKCGGYGCARDVIEQVLRAQGLWMNDSNAFGW